MLIRSVISRRRCYRILTRYFSTNFGENVLVNVLSEQGGISVKVIDATRLINDACTAHECSHVASVALGRTITGNLLLAHGRDDNESYQIQINGNGVLGRIVSECVSQGGVLRAKGFVQRPQAQLPPREDGTLDVSGAVGIGMLQVHRSHPSWKEPFSGSVMLETSEIAEDMATYLGSSEQTNSALWLFVDVDNRGTVVSALGYLCTVLPGCLGDEIDTLEKNIAEMSCLQRAVKENRVQATDIADMLIKDLGEQFREYNKVELRCTCSKDKYMKGMLSLGKDELNDMIRLDEDVNIRCDWCSKIVHISCSDLKTLVGDCGLH